MATSKAYWLIICSAIVIATACENNVQEVTALTRKVQEVEEGKNIKAIFSRSANLAAYLTAPTMQRVKGDTQYVDFPNTIHVDFYNDLRVLQNVVTAKFARYYEGLNKVFLKDSVVVYNMVGDTLLCQTLWWNQTEELFYTDDSVYIRSLTRNLRGTGFRSKSDFSKYTIDNVVGPVLLPGETADSSAAPVDTLKPVVNSKPTVAKPQ
ncbi:LPS export ABC transporter periplasmic protein LptC [Phnomibacter sp. MR]|uniref:LPS export ABC transporter periplasmic protein LptC n=1 Tax=Phnomibacter sp. MR TaxID=3042318 RepID=UPI003A7F6817